MVSFLISKTSRFQFNLQFLWHFNKNNTPRFVVTGSPRAMKTQPLNTPGFGDIKIQALCPILRTHKLWVTAGQTRQQMWGVEPGVIRLCVLDVETDRFRFFFLSRLQTVMVFNDRFETKLMRPICGQHGSLIPLLQSCVIQLNHSCFYSESVKRLQSHYLIWLILC
jgi:hypothetical protein